MKIITILFSLLALCVGAVAAPTKEQSMAAARASAVTGFCAGIGPYYWEIGDKLGPLASGSVNSTSTKSYTATSSMRIASASKWLYGGYAAQTRTLTPEDFRFLHMSAGYVTFSLCGRRQTVGSCAAGATYTASADGKFDYGGGHMQHLAAVTGMEKLNSTTLANAVTTALGTTVKYNSPQLAGGAQMTPAAYALFLRRLMAGSLKLSPLLGSNAVCTNARTCSTAVGAPIPSSESWHYSVAHWVEDDPVQGDGSFSSPGAFGFYPWISADRTLYGVLARDAGGGAWSSVQCGRQIRKAWVTGVAS